MKNIHFIVVLILFSCQCLLAQKTVSGVVNDAEGLPLPGANVIEEGTQQSASTDMDGKYLINVKSASSVLSFSYTGFISKKVVVGSKAKIDVNLAVAANTLEEVIVVGYGTQKKSDVTGAISSISAKTLEDRPQINIAQAIQGSLPGVSINVNSNTASGASNSINIRGKRSITGGSDPLIVMDGVIFSGGLSDVNINDVQNIEVLKDASSVAIYGSRGANGVILITTKKGKKDGKPRINFSTYYGADIAYKLPDMMDAETFYKRKVERYGIDSFLITATERAVYASGKYADWVDLAVRDGSRTEHNLSVAGGTKNSTYFISGNYQNVEGIAVNDNFAKISFRSNLEIDVTSWLKLGTNTTFKFSDQSGIGASFSEAFSMNPLTIPFNPDGSLTKQPWAEDNGFDNPLENTAYNNVDKDNSLVTNNYFLVELPFIKGLNYKLNTGYTIRNSKEQTYRGMNTQSGSEVNGYANEVVQETKEYLVENILNYNRSFGKHNVFATALYSAQQATYESINLTGTGFASDDRTFYQFSDAKVTKANAGYSKKNDVGTMLRLNYNYDSRYLLTLTTRRDGSSVFGPNDKYGVFPSVALGWNISKESFLENSKFINQLKLRVSVGESGSQALDSYASLAVMNKQDYIDGSGNNLLGYRPGRLSSPYLGWETSKSYNAGVDFGILKNRISGSVDVYKTETRNLLLNVSLPAINGVTQVLSNIGQTKGNGLEIALNTRNISTDNFSWNSQISFSRTKTKIANVGLTDANGNYIDDVGSKWFIGKPIDVNFGYVIEGIWQTDQVAGVTLSDYAAKAAGDVKYKDISGPNGVPDNKIDQYDRTIIGSLQPDFTVGFNNNITYKNFSLDFFFYAVQGITKRSALITTNDFNLRQKVYNVNYWSPTNPTNDFPENTAARSTNALAGGWYEDASYIRLKDVTLGYKFSKELIDKLGVSNMELFLNAKNPVTFTKWRGIDPESSNQTDRPFARTFIFGVRLGL